MPEPKSPFKRVRRAFDEAALKRVCELKEEQFGDMYDMEKWVIEERNGRDDFYFFRNNGSNILAVAHLDTVVSHAQRTASFVETKAGPVVFSGALDDRLGAYTILELLPKLGINYDILLTVGEESGQSTGEYFDPPKEYNWMIEFDRGGTSVVMYQYDDKETRDLVRESGARPENGIFSDISYMEHLEIKGFNWGVGYQDYHGVRSHAFLEDYWMMLGHYLKFHDANADTYLPHEKVVSNSWGRYGGSTSYMWDSSSTTYQSQKGEKWWDEQDETEDASQHWSEAEWNAYLDGGMDAVKALHEEEIDIDIILVDDDDVVSDDFTAVNRALTAASDS